MLQRERVVIIVILFLNICEIFQLISTMAVLVCISTNSELGVAFFLHPLQFMMSDMLITVMLNELLSQSSLKWLRILKKFKDNYWSFVFFF